MNAVTQTIELASERLTQKQEDFARCYVECRNATTAYRMVYNVGRETRWMTIASEAWRLLHHPRVSLRIQELRDAAEAHTIIKARELVQDWVDIASLDANELVTLHTNNCRHCYGQNFRYQWADEEELADAVQAAQDMAEGTKKAPKMPDARGGFGFVVRREPNPDCPKCEGRGSVVVRFTDTDKLSTRARKMYKGAKVTSQGTELLMHDAAAARETLGRVLGLGGKDVTLNPAAPAKPLDADVNEADAATAYLELVNGS